MTKFIFLCGGVLFSTLISSEKLSAQCGITGMQPQIALDSSFPIENTSGSNVTVTILSGNYPTTIGVEDSGGTPGNAKLFSPAEAGAIVSGPTTNLGIYQVRINNSTMGCVDTVDVEVVTTLPLQLLDQSAKWEDEDIHITFTTASRVNTDKTYAQLSEDGTKFTTVDSLEYAQADASHVENHEIVVEREEIETIFGRLQPGQSVYIRLQNRDLDGSQQTGAMMFIKVDGKLSVSTAMLYPNPAYDQIYIEMSGSTNVQVTLISHTGEAMLVDIPVQSGNSLDISGIASGIYTVIISDTESSRTESIRLVK